MSDSESKVVVVDFDELRRPFGDGEVQWRVDQVLNWQSGMHVRLLAYIDARAAMERLDRACTPAGWSDSYTAGPQGGVMCTLSLKAGGEWVSKQDVGENTKIEATKGGVSDAFKRACVKWGLGRNLYAIGDTVVPVVRSMPAERAVKIYSKRDNVEGWAQAPHIQTGAAETLPAPQLSATGLPAAPKPGVSEVPGSTDPHADWPVPPCPVCNGKGERRTYPNPGRQPSFRCVQEHGDCVETSRSNGQEYPRSYWRPRDGAMGAARAKLRQYSSRHNMGEEEVLGMLSDVAGVPASIRAWAQGHCAKALDALSADLDGREPLQATQPEGEAPEATEQREFFDDVPF